MAFKLTSEELKTLKDLTGQLAQTEQLLTDQINSYNELTNEIEEFRSKVVERLKEEFDAKSEKWQETENGSAAGGMIDAWEGLAIEEIDVSDDLFSLDSLPEEA